MKIIRPSIAATKQVKDAVNICVESLDSQAPETKEIIKREVMYITRTDDITGV